MVAVTVEAYRDELEDASDGMLRTKVTRGKNSITMAAAKKMSRGELINFEIAREFGRESHNHILMMTEPADLRKAYIGRTVPVMLGNRTIRDGLIFPTFGEKDTYTIKMLYDGSWMIVGTWIKAAVERNCDNQTPLIA